MATWGDARLVCGEHLSSFHARPPLCTPDRSTPHRAPVPRLPPRLPPRFGPIDHVFRGMGLRNEDPNFAAKVRGRNPAEAEKGLVTIMDIAVLAQVLSSLATFVVAAGILYQGREARRARDDEDRPQIIVDADYTGRFTT